MKQYYDPYVFNVIPESLDREKYITATYYMKDICEGDELLDHYNLVEFTIREASTSSWMDIKEETGEVLEKLSGKLIGYYEIPTEAYTKEAIIQCAFPTAAWDRNFNIPMMMLSIAAGAFTHSKSLRLLDVGFPETLAKKFPGPKFGIDGVRKILGVKGRPLVLHIIKPKMGMIPEQVADQVYRTALGGADMMKDDEMTSDVFNSSFEDRVIQVTKSLKKAEKVTGKKAIYFVSITDEPNTVVERAKKAIELGARGLLISYTSGMSAVKFLAEDHDVNVPILLHPAGLIPLLPKINFPTLAKILRLCGSDILLGPSLWSSNPVASLEEALRFGQVLIAPFYDIKKTFPMIGGGMYPGLAEIIIKEYGSDIVIASGGGMLGHPNGYTAGAKAWRQAIDAVMNNIPLKVAAEKNSELKVALDYWGTFERPATPWSHFSKKFRPAVAYSR
jgi:2,3-diketo-5-methylthiopentyl-1-phosphate enolase